MVKASTPKALLGDSNLNALVPDVVPGARDFGLRGARQTGTEGSDTLTGGPGADRLEGLGGDDILIGNAGNDILDGGAGKDRMRGGTGDDTYIVDSVDDRIEEGVDAGIDTVRTTTTTFSLGANVENLRFLGTTNAVGVGNRLDNSIVGTIAGDTLSGLDGNDTLIGGGGNDVLVGGAGSDILEGGEGADRFLFSTGESTVDAPDRIRDFDVDGGDVIELGGALNFIGTTAFTGTGAPELRYQQQGGSTFVSGDNDGDGTADFAIRLDGNKVLTEDDFRISGNRNLTGTEGSDTLIGGPNADRLEGLGGNDVLIGNAGDDTLDGGTGNDRMLGGAGDDTYIVDSVSDRVEEDGGAGNDTIITSFPNYTIGANVENLRFSIATNAVGVGNGLNNSIVGTIAGDTLSGLGGDDTLAGGGGNDVLVGGAGSDIIEGGDGADRFLFSNGESTLGAPDRIRDFDVDGGDVIELGGSLSFIGANAFSANGTPELRYQRQDGSTSVLVDSGGDGTADFSILLDGDKVLTEDDFRLSGGRNLRGTEGADTLTGGANDDELRGFGGDDVLIGNGGIDLLDGGTGADRMQGGAGDDQYFVDTLSDRIDEGVDSGIDTVNTTTTTYTLGANLENLIFQGTSTAVGVGNALANRMVGTIAGDTLNGLDGNDVLNSFEGDDVLVGGAGRDTLSGSSGSDRFVFFGGESAVDAPDRIEDFRQDESDVIDLSSFADLEFIGGAAFSGGGGAELRFESQATVNSFNTLVFGDTNGDGTADFSIQLAGSITLTEGDFRLAPSTDMAAMMM